MAYISKITDVTGTTYDLKDSQALSGISFPNLNDVSLSYRNNMTITVDNPVGEAVTELEEYTKKVIRSQNNHEKIVVEGDDDGDGYAEIDFNNIKLQDYDNDICFETQASLVTVETPVLNQDNSAPPFSYYCDLIKVPDQIVSLKINGVPVTVPTNSRKIIEYEEHGEWACRFYFMSLSGPTSVNDNIEISYIARNEVSCSSLGKRRGTKGLYSIAEGYLTTASGEDSHAEGFVTKAIGAYAHAEGGDTEAKGKGSHAEGLLSIAFGDYSHAQNRNTIARGNSQTALGKFNVEDLNNEYAVIVGNGTADGSRSNALTLDWDGNAAIAGNITTSGNISGGGISGSTLTTTGNISSNGSINILSSNLDNTVTPSSNVTGSNHLYLKDKNGVIFTNLYSQKLTSGTNQSVFMNQNGSNNNYIVVGTASNGTANYGVKDKAAFRSAIELNRTQTALTLSNTSAGSCTLVRNAIMATVFLNDVKLSAALANGSSVTVATVPTGYRPAQNAMGYLTSVTNGQAPIKWYVSTGGNVGIQNRSGASLATSVALSGTITYVI